MGEAAVSIPSPDQANVIMHERSAAHPARARALDAVLADPRPAALIWGATGDLHPNDACLAMLAADTAAGRPGGAAATLADHLAPAVARVLRTGLPERVDEDVASGAPAATCAPVVDADAPSCVGGVMILCEPPASRRDARFEGEEIELLSCLFSRAPAPTCMLVGPDLRIAFANEAFEALAGEAAPIGRPVRSAMPDIEGQGFFERLEEVARTGEAFALRRAPMMRRWGGASEPATRYIDFVYQPVRDRAGRPWAVLVQGADVTDAVAAERAMADNERLLRHVIDNLFVFVGLLDLQGTLVEVNRAPLAAAGLTRDDVIGKPFWDCRWWSLSEADRERLRAAIARARDGETVRYDVEIAGIGDARIIIDFQIAPLRDDDGRVVSLLPSGVDITGRKRMETALRQSEARAIGELQELDSIYRTAPIGLGMFDRDLRVIRINDALAEINGHAPADHVGRVIWDLVPDVRAAAEPLMRRVLDAGETIHAIEIEGETPARPGETRQWVETLYPIRDDRDDIVAVGAICEEVTHKRAAEAALLAMNADLERRVAQAVGERETALAKLHESQKMETIGQLTGGIAHDFNNLLSAILSNLELLAKRLPEGERDRRLVDGAIQGAQRGVSLTRRLLAFARRQELHSTTVSVAGLIEGVADLVVRAIGPSVQLKLDLPDDLPPVTVDANQLELAILNLSVNARDAMPDGGRLTVRARLESVDGDGVGDLAPGDYVRVDVIDTGVGMDDETLRRAAEPFFTTKGVGKGTGLGLSMVQGLAVQSGGALRLDSRPGHGSSASLWVPCAVQGASPAAGAGPAGAPAATTRDDLDDAASARSLLVLVVDDDPLVGMGTAAMVEDLGHRVLEATSGREALEIARAHPDLDLVVTDHAMPGMTGTELARRLAEVAPGLPVVLATGYADLPHGETHSLPRLAKPFRQEDLAALIERTV